ncbi:MAG: hypothetical protein WC562_06835 [Dehalococcoidia bacterium]
MIKKETFEVGQTYSNRKGKYTVVAIDGDVMRISWKKGQEVDTTVKLQSRVLDNIQKELEELALVKAKIASPVKRSRAAVTI